MEIGQNGSLGLYAACLAGVEQERGLENVKILNQKMVGVFVQEVMPKLTIVTMIHAQFMETGPLGVIGALAHQHVEVVKDTDIDHVQVHPHKMEAGHVLDKQLRKVLAVCKCVLLMVIGLNGAHGLHVRISKARMFSVEAVDKKDSGLALILLLSLEEELVLVMQCKRKNAIHNPVTSHHLKHLVRLLVT